MALTPDPKAPGKSEAETDAERKKKKEEECRDEPERELQKFPAWRYHKEHPAVIVQSEEDAKKLGGGWSEEPVDETDGDDHRRDDPSYQTDPRLAARPEPPRHEAHYPDARAVPDPNLTADKRKDDPVRPPVEADRRRDEADKRK